MARALLNTASSYTPEKAEAILAQLREGVSLSRICRAPDMPDRNTVHNWVKNQPGFRAAYEEARDLGFDAIADDVMEIADETEHDTIETKLGPRANAEWIARSKLRVWTRLQLLEKWSHRYRNQQGIQLSNANGGPVEFTDAAAAAKIASLLALARAREEEDERPADGSDLA